MCGLAGIVLQQQAKLDASKLESMLAAMVHRGPDGSGVYVDQGAGLAHCRLSIIDLAGGQQPLFNQDKSLILVANGEIYNHIELRQDLEQRGHQFSTHSDCETILHAYAEYGDDCLGYLQGMFVFALYDQTDNRVLLARDPLGMKPLFFTRCEGQFVFASEIKALLPVLKDVQVNADGLAQYLQNQNTTGRTTILQGVERLLPGEAVVIENGRIQKQWAYWSALNVEPRDIDEQQAMSEFDGLMETVMTQHMRSDVPFGLFLSGGVDSTTLLGLLARYKDEPIRTFSVGFPKSSVGDELEIAETLAQRFGSQHTVLRPAPESMLPRLVYTVWAADDLMRDFANLPTSLLAESAGEELKVVFSGEGGDEAFAGYGRYNSSSIERKLKKILIPGSGGFRTSGNFRRSLSQQLFGEKLLARQSHWRTAIKKAWAETPANWSDLQRMQYVDLVNALPDNLLVKADRMLMAWSVEGRLPFVDSRVIEFGLSLPDALKIEGKQGKVFLKRWAAKFLPDDHLWKKKRGFSVPVNEWLQGDYLNAVAEVLKASAGIQQWFKADAVGLLLVQQQKRGKLAKNIMALLQFAIWHRLFIEGDGTRPPEQIDPVRFLKGEL